jgi:hypothetical protein
MVKRGPTSATTSSSASKWSPGEVGFQLGGVERVARAGDPAVEVPVGMVHELVEGGAGIAQVRFAVDAAPGAPGRPAARFAELIEVRLSLEALGRERQGAA